MCAVDRSNPKLERPMSASAQISSSSEAGQDTSRRSTEGATSIASYQRVIEKCASGLAVLSLDGSIREVNPAFSELTGRSRESLSTSGFNLERVFVLDDVASYRRHVTALSRGEEETFRQPLRFVRQDGIVIWVDLTVNLLREEGGAPSRLVITAIDVTEQRRAETAFRDMSFRDPLTKLPNRRLLRDRLQSAVARAERDGANVALLFLDLDKFKSINDSLGHEVGDWLLKAVAQRLESCLRSYDTAARLGGDEFVVLLPDLAQRDDVYRVAERIQSALSTPFITDDGRRLEVSVSIGVSIYPEHAENASDLLHASDAAMYSAKKSGRNRIAYSDRTPEPASVPQPVSDVNSGLVHLTWEPGFASGNAFIDTEHRELFRQSNQLLDLAMRTEVKPHAVYASLVHLVRSVGAHFQHEERILAQAGYAGLVAHATRHRQLMERADELCQRARDQPVTAGDILDFVVAKMIHGHVVTEDRDYFALLKAHADK
jgi:diguanylate cyclase (GGDEF)-like protein/hemerythrin-like metal-binding protein/PAS domain S-box-containing protein